jgi:hypothetical protein
MQQVRSGQPRWGARLFAHARLAARKAALPVSLTIPHAPPFSQKGRPPWVILYLNRVIRLGVYRLDQYPPTWLRRGHLDYRLLRAATPPSPRELAVFEDITRRMQLSSGVYRTTSPSRLRALDEWSTGLLAKHFDSAAALDVQDWAASDCSTSVAWHGRLITAFPHAILTASDLNVYLVEMKDGARGSYILDAALQVLQFVNPPFVIRLRPAESPWLAVNWLLARRVSARFEQFRRDHRIEPDSVRFPPGTDELSRGPLLFRRIPLIHPSAFGLSRQDPSFRIDRHSIFEPSAKPAHVIRTMNILNTAYFDSSEIERSARNIWCSLQPDGVWIVGRTVQEEPLIHHASIMVKTAEGFRLLDRYTQKSEVEDLALKVRM